MVSDVKEVNPEQWRDPSQGEKLARKYEERIKQIMDAYKAYRDEYEQRTKRFVDSYKDAMKNRSSNVDEWIHKYGKNVDRKSD
jgi:uncharacterized protein involved in exopolysaccharide biosynthesis